MNLTIDVWVVAAELYRIFVLPTQNVGFQFQFYNSISK